MGKGLRSPATKSGRGPKSRLKAQAQRSNPTPPRRKAGEGTVRRTARETRRPRFARYETRFEERPRDGRGGRGGGWTAASEASLSARGASEERWAPRRAENNASLSRRFGPGAQVT